MTTSLPNFHDLPSADVKELPSMALDEQDKLGMQLALDQALNAQLAGEVPVGAVVLHRTGEGVRVLATGYNRPITTNDPTAHAEVIALRQAAQMLENYRLPEVEVYVTLEPCAMCAMALMHARVKRVVFGARDPKTGACGSVVNLFADTRLNHHTVVEGDVQSERSSRLLKDFFAERRAAHRAAQAVSKEDAAAEATLPIPTVIEDDAWSLPLQGSQKP